MRTLRLILVLASLVAGILGFVTPSLTATPAASGPTTISITNDHPAPLFRVACGAGPCDCPEC